MKQRRLALLCVGALLIAGLAFGEDSWLRKEYTQWTDDEVRKILKDSPWAKDVTVNAPLGAAFAGPVPRPDAGTSGIDAENNTPGRGGRGGRGARGGGSESAAPPEVLLTLNISWRSALPLRKALVKSRVGTSGDVPADLQQMLSREDDNYVIVLSGLPARMARDVQNSEEIKQSMLKRGKKPAIPVGALNFSPHTQTVDVIFMFPKTDRITADDRDVEVVLKLGQIEAKRKFNLKEMTYNGKLEL